MKGRQQGWRVEDGVIDGLEKGVASWLWHRLMLGIIAFITYYGIVLRLLSFHHVLERMNFSIVASIWETSHVPDSPQRQIACGPLRALPLLHILHHRFCRSGTIHRRRRFSQLEDEQELSMPMCWPRPFYIFDISLSAYHQSPSTLY